MRSSITRNNWNFAIGDIAISLSGWIVLVAWAFAFVNRPGLAAESAEPDTGIVGIEGITPPLVLDPHKVLGYESCAKCHANEVNTWKQTPHCRTFDELHRKPEAKEIAKRLGLRSVKREGVCVQCHYTSQYDGEESKPTSGVSCESCHGPAADWISMHNDLGNAATSGAREKRREECIAAGMRNPVNIYLIARSCYNCHTAPQERLVNQGGHRAGSQDFELVAWSQGQVAHNFLRGGGASTPSGIARLRVMFVVGVLTDLEYSLRAVANATEDGPYGRQAAQRAATDRKKIAFMQLQLRHPLLQNALDAFEGVELASNNAAALLKTADAVGQSALKFADQEDGEALSPIDALLPTPQQYRW